jgi:hypothetical protein
MEVTAVAPAQAKNINFMFWLKAIALGALVLSVVGILHKLGLFKAKTQADKLQDAKDAEDKTKAINLSKSDALKISKISDISKIGMGAAEGHNQFPYTPAQVTDMVMNIYKTKTTFTKGDGSNAIAVINELPSKFAVNNIGLSFQAAYSQDLFSFLRSNVTDAGLAAINDAIADKPDFVKLLPASQELLKKRNQTLTL